MSKQTTSKVPQIRFKGFEYEWAEEPLLSRIKDVIDFRGRTPKKLGMDWSPSGYLALSALNVKDGYIDRYADAHYGDEELYTKWMKGNELHCNQVLFTTEAPMGNVAQIPDTQKYILSQRTIAFVTDAERLSENYLAVLLKSPNVFGMLLARSSGGTAKGISQKSLASIHVRVSDELTEQAQIGEYFRELDRLIGLHQRKHDKLLTLKKAMLQKMFPQRGATTPEIRFKGFSEPWEEKTFAEVAYVFDGTHQTPQYTTEGVMFLSVENIHSLRSAKFISKDAFKNEFKTFPQKGDVLMTRIGDVGTANVVETNEPIAYYVSLALLKLKSADPYFIKYCISSDLVTKALFHRTLHIAFPKKINKNEIEKVEISLPKFKPEQQKIGTYFRTLDELISKHATQLQKLQQIKSACLEKMFV